MSRNLLEQLEIYSQTDYYPFHMPGHKRQGGGLSGGLPFSIDITEIEGFDNLHHPEGILREAMDRAASVYGSDKTYFLINGSTGGILSAICSCISMDGKILMNRNSHKAAFHGIFLKRGKMEYVYPQIVSKYPVFGGLLTDNIREIVDKLQDIEAIFVTSPTYEGILPHISEIAEIAHRKNIPLIVDEAHGAHLPFSKEFPASALEQGADIVIQSLHKTLPALTQTAVLHVKSKLVDIERLEYYLQLFQSSSPSYVMLASADYCVRLMEEKGRELMSEYKKKLDYFMEQAQGFQYLKIMGDEIVGQPGIEARDPSKLLISTLKAPVNGGGLAEILRKKYHLETEMTTESSVLAMTSILDTMEGFDRLLEALVDLERQWKMEGISVVQPDPAFECPHFLIPVPGISMAEAMEARWTAVDFSGSEGMISNEFITIYPPGIPLTVPGERVTKEIILRVEQARAAGLSIEGMKDSSGKTIRAVEER